LNFDSNLAHRPTAAGSLRSGVSWVGVEALQPEELAVCDGPIGPEDVLALTQASLHDMASTSRCVSDWLRRDWHIEDIYLHGIVAAARLQGLWWVRDQLDFSALTVGCSRLHRVLYELSPVFLADAEPAKDATVLLLPEPDSQHTMGLFMLSEFFRRGGWHTLLLQPDELGDTLRIVGSHWIDVMAISVASDRHFEHLRHLIGQVRQHSANPHLRIIAGGPMASCMPDTLLSLGVDALGTDAKTTVEGAHSHIRSRTAG
jgi:methylmalonyl-CoA mutase cobalamin-binding subunit